jgi:hypothetical protein
MEVVDGQEVEFTAGIGVGRSQGTGPDAGSKTGLQEPPPA